MRSCASRHMSVFDTSLMYVCPRVVYMPETGHEGAQECARGRVRVQSPPTHIYTRARAVNSWDICVTRG